MRSRLLLSVVLAAGLTAACSAPTARPEAGNDRAVTVTARDLTFSPDTLTLEAGARVRLTLINEGTLEHDMTVEDLIAGDRSISAVGDAHGQIRTRAGERVTVDFTPKTGTYEFYCSVPGHRQAGMIGTLRVG